nr:hypothetical protein [Nitrosomonas nitrosa]
MPVESPHLNPKDYQHLLGSHPELPLRERKQLEQVVQDQVREANLQLDELSYQMNDVLLNTLRRAVEHLVETGKLTAEEATDELANLEDYLMNIPEVEHRLFSKDDHDGWLSAWLTRHPEYVEEDLGGEWPDWLRDS